MADEKELNKLPERFNWSKLFRGLFVASNYGKALVLSICFSIMFTLGYCVVVVVKARFAQPKPIPTTQVGSNQGTVSTVSNDNHSSVKVTHYHLPLSDLFNWFGWQTTKEEKTNS